MHSYSGASSHVVGFAERKAHSEEVMAPPIETYQRMKKAGMPVEILTGASTGTYNIDPFLEEITELQVGSYIFMDVDYQIIGGEGGKLYDDFAPALTVLTTVMSKRHRDLATLDAGMKAFATDRESVPEIKGISGTEYQFGGDEHGMLQLPNPSREIKTGGTGWSLWCPTATPPSTSITISTAAGESRWKATGRWPAAGTRRVG